MVQIDRLGGDSRSFAELLRGHLSKGLFKPAKTIFNLIQVAIPAPPSKSTVSNGG